MIFSEAKYLMMPVIHGLNTILKDALSADGTLKRMQDVIK
jgi:hypothetical protein